MLAWYAHTHRGEPQLLHALIDNLRPGDNGSRDVAPLLLADPLVLGLDPATVQRALHTELGPRRSGYPLPTSGAFLALVARFPDDTAVADAWEALQRERGLHGQVEVDVSVYYPLAYAAVETADFVEQVVHDSAWISSHFTNDVDPPFAQAVIRRLERAPEARTQADAAITSTDTSDTQAAQLASLSSAATALPRTSRTTCASDSTGSKAFSCPMPCTTSSPPQTCPSPLSCCASCSQEQGDDTPSTHATGRRTADGRAHSSSSRRS